ncbi:uncharacterized protein [Nerophis lumbriciformis]|uniref:uncharacterized protein n=1 Tax=Nerophis lumbriciformis TaxID=546530 RepID=UPI003BAA52AC
MIVRQLIHNTRWRYSTARTWNRKRIHGDVIDRRPTGSRGNLKAEMADIQTVLQRSERVLLAPCGDLDQSDLADSADGTLLFMQDSRQVKKVLWRQFYVLDSMMRVLEGQHLLTQPCPPPAGGGARDRWKAAKAESRTMETHLEALISTLHRNIQHGVSGRHTLTHLLQQLHSKKQQREDVDECVQKAHNALQRSESQLTQLRAELKAVLAYVDVWQRSRDDFRAYLSDVHDVTPLHLLSFDQSQLSLECRHKEQASHDVEPLKVSVRWSHDDRFTLQVSQPGLALHSVSGGRSELGTALLEVMQYYMGQARLLSEIQHLRSSFAIDWLPASRVLVYLKSASLVCHLQVQEGYPDTGAVSLLSVHRDAQPVDTCGLQPSKPHSRLTDWLILLCSSPLI